jgi:AcrR family transcriptional regulator
MSGADRRTQLLDLARDIVADESFSALTIDRIARAAHVSRTVIYQQFTDLPGLMDALLDRESAIAFAGIDSVTWTEGSDQDVDQLGRGVLAYLHAAPTSWRIILRPTDGAPPELHARIAMGRAYARSIAGCHLSQAVGAPVDPDGATVRILLASIEELARIHLDDPRSHPDEQVLEYLRSLFAWSARAEVGAPTAD